MNLPIGWEIERSVVFWGHSSTFYDNYKLSDNFSDIVNTLKQVENAIIDIGNTDNHIQTGIEDTIP